LQIAIVSSEEFVHWTYQALGTGVQIEHEATFEVKENEPAIQGVHVVAPAPVPVFVREPALHF